MRATRRVVTLLLSAIGCLGAVAYAASPHGSPGSAPTPERNQGAASLPKPSIARHPDKLSMSPNANFGFSARGRGLRFQCRLDGRAWELCRSPVTVGKLALGSHKFSVRTLDRRGRHSKGARFRWRVLEPKDFAIVPRLADLSALYPGAPPLPLPLTIANPNPVPIFVTGLHVAASAEPPGCPSSDNLLLADSSATSSTPVKVPAGGSVSLPGPGATAPTIQLRDLPANQDACQKAQFPLTFSGEARG
jgi:hypothetical protein